MRRRMPHEESPRARARSDGSASCCEGSLAMTKKQIWQYRCDFCGKRNLSSGHMKSHEKYCTMNPQRECRLHKYCDGAQQPIAELISALCSPMNGCLHDWEKGMEALRKISSECPMCMLAAIRQCGENFADKETGEFQGPIFNFKEELAEFWKISNDARAEEAAEYHHY